MKKNTKAAAAATATEGHQVDLGVKTRIELKVTVTRKIKMGQERLTPGEEDSEGEINEPGSEDEDVSDDDLSDTEEVPGEWDCDIEDGTCGHYSRNFCEEEAAHRVRMKALIEENLELKSITDEQDRVLEAMHLRTIQIRRATEEYKVKLAKLRYDKAAREREESEAEMEEGGSGGGSGGSVNEENKTV